MRRHVPRTDRLIVTLGLAFVVVLLVGLMFFANIWRVGSSYAVSAYVENARGIAPDSTVFEAGLPVGIVTGVRRNGADAVLSLRLDHGVRPLPVDSKVQLGLRSLAGEADVLVYPGRSTQLVRNGGSLGLSQDVGYTEVDQILSAFAPPAESNFRGMIRGLGNGVAGEGQNLNGTLGGFAHLVTASLPLTSTLAAQHRQVATLVQNLGEVMAAIGQRAQATRQFAQGALTTFTDISRRDIAFKGMLGALPGLLRGASDATQAIGSSSQTISPLLVNLADAVRRLSPAIGLLKPGSTEGLRVLQALGTASPPLTSVLENLVRLRPSAQTALPALRSTLCQLDPMVRYIKPYAGDLGPAIENFGAADSAYDGAPGHNHDLLASISIDPTNPVFGIESQSVNESLNGALNTLFNLGVFHKLAPGNGYHIVPPGHMDDGSIGVGENGPIDWGKTHPFPQVKPDCAR